jgi:AbrB family looped-hinge helix DNA binding protein
VTVPGAFADGLMYDSVKIILWRSMSETESEKVVSVSSRGQATIPKEFREELGIETPGRVKFVRTDEGEVVVRPIRSVTDLRGVLAGKTDGEGRSATERLREERERDRASAEGLRRRYVDDDEGEP